MKINKLGLGIVSTLAALLLAACGGGGDPLGQESSPVPTSPAPDGGAVVVGSADFPESRIIAELYAQAMKAKGVNVTTRLGIGAREVYIKALQDNSISVVPEYTGNLLQNFDKQAKASTPEDVEAALPGALPQGLQVLKSSKATDQDVYVVTKEFSARNGITSLEDLKKISSEATLGGPPELETRPYGVSGLESSYGAKFKAFKPYKEIGPKVSDLNANKIQVATFFTTESVIGENGYVQLEDPKSMILPQNVIPLVRSEVTENTAATAAIDSVQAALTTEDLVQMNRSYTADRMEPDEIAAEWLRSKGLV